MSAVASDETKLSNGKSDADEAWLLAASLSVLPQQDATVDVVQDLLVDYASEIARSWPGRGHQQISITDSAVIGQVLVADVLAVRSAPPCDVSSMDGYAFVADDAEWPKSVVATSAPGAELSLEHLAPRQAIRILTGAPLIAGADTVVPQEWCKVDGDLVDVVAPRAAASSMRRGDVAVGLFVRARGSDARAGSVVASRGDVLSPARIGSIAAAGVAFVDVAVPIRVGVLSTGDEIVDVADVASMGSTMVVDSARPALLAAIASDGFDAIDLGHVGDDMDALITRVLESLDRVDVLITIGGVSVGDHDYLPRVLQQIAPARFRRFAIGMQPGKPFACTSDGERLVVACPGNPVSALVHWRVLIEPATRVLAGIASTGRPIATLARLTSDVAGPGDDRRIRFLRAVIDDCGGATILGGQQSHQMLDAGRASHLVVIAPGQHAVADTIVQVVRL